MYDKKIIILTRDQSKIEKWKSLQPSSTMIRH